jgi:hypothetical protein
VKFVTVEEMLEVQCFKRDKERNGDDCQQVQNVRFSKSLVILFCETGHFLFFIEQHAHFRTQGEESDGK